MTAKAAPISEADALDVARVVFGMDGRAVALTGERDANFRIETADGAYVLKFTHAAEAREVTAFQTRALLHIADVDPLLPVPRVAPTRAGRAEHLAQLPGQEPRIVRLLSYLPGLLAHQAPQTSGLRKALGATLGRLGLALESLAGIPPEHDLLWDLGRAGRMRDLLNRIGEAPRRGRVERVLDVFEADVAPRLPGLRRQVVHHDLNLHNAVVDPAAPDRVTGVLDFGDLMQAPLVADLAVAAAYHVTPGPRPLEGPAELVQAYDAVRPLRAEERALLFDLIRTRLAMTVCISAWRSGLHPENATYILRNAPAAWAALEALDGVDRGRATEHWARNGGASA